MYVFGGFDGKSVLKQASVFDTATNKWSALPDMPGGTWESCATVAQGKIYVIGGSEPPTRRLAAHLRLRRGVFQLVGVGSVPVPVRNAACATISNRPALFGGWTRADGPVRYTWAFDADRLAVDLAAADAGSAGGRRHGGHRQRPLLRQRVGGW